MQEKKEIFDRLVEWFFVVFYALVGVGAKIAHINKNQKVTRKQAIAAIAMGIFGGILCNSVCDYYKIEGHLKSAFISVAALSGENITSWILGNVEGILNWLKSKFMRSKK